MDIDITYRLVSSEELGFVLKPMLSFYDNLELEIARSIVETKLSSCQIWVAEHDSVLLAFVAVDKPFVAFAYTKSGFRKIGICRRLIEIATGRYKPIITKTVPKKHKEQFTYSKEEQVWIKQ